MHITYMYMHGCILLICTDAYYLLHGCILYTMSLPGTQGELGAHVGRETSGNAGEGGREGKEGGRIERERGMREREEEW